MRANKTVNVEATSAIRVANRISEPARNMGGTGSIYVLTGLLGNRHDGAIGDPVPGHKNVFDTECVVVSRCEWLLEVLHQAMVIPDLLHRITHGFAFGATGKLDRLL